MKSYTESSVAVPGMFATEKHLIVLGTGDDLEIFEVADEGKAIREWQLLQNEPDTARRRIRSYCFIPSAGEYGLIADTKAYRPGRNMNT